MDERNDAPAAEPPHTDVTSTDTGGPDMVQLLSVDGVRATQGHYADLVSDITPEVLRSRYRDLVLCRRFDDEATALQRQGELGLWAGMRGQEAAQIGSGRALRAQDFAFPTYREHAVAWTRGVPPASILALYRGVELGGWDPDQHNFALYCLVIGSQTLHATGYAMGVQRDGAVGTGDPERDTAVVAYFGDGATSQGDVSEAFVFAASFHAPVVFFCQNNQWAISVPTSRQSQVPLYQRGLGFGIPGVRVDGNDVLAVEAVTRAALERARSGGGPMLVEAYTYRMAAHTTSDDTTRYRDAAEEQSWAQRDPILRVRRHLQSIGEADQDWLDALDREAGALGADIRRQCLEMREPPARTMFQHVYAAEHAPLARELADFDAYHAGEAAPVGVPS